MGLISPRQLYDEPWKYLTVNPRVREDVDKLMVNFYPDWPKRLEDYKVDLETMTAIDHNGDLVVCVHKDKEP